MHFRLSVLFGMHSLSHVIHLSSDLGIDNKLVALVSWYVNNTSWLGEFMIFAGSDFGFAGSLVLAAAGS